MKRYYKLFLTFSALFALTFFVGQNVNAQNENPNPDSTNLRTHSPKKATYWALLPGAGQVYNKKYWKLPIVYAGFGASSYYAFANRKEYLLYNEAYTCSVLEGDDCTNELANKYSSEDLKYRKDFYRRNMELSFIIMSAWYVLQILDASVDAHLYYWEVNEDLTVDVQPIIQPRTNGLMPMEMGQKPAFNGIKVSFKF